MSLVLIQLTPPGRGAVATLRVEGPGALHVVQRHLLTRNGRPLADFQPGRIVIGQFVAQTPRLPDAAEMDTPLPGEEVVVHRESDSAIELHCHGGQAAITRIEQILVNGGCRRISWQEWVYRQEADPFAAAARLALAAARTRRTAAILLDQYRGALRRAVEKIEASLQAGALDDARQGAEALLAHAQTGLHLARPWQVVIAGPPNVGKSSLVNAIAGYQRAIVHSTPGTTRDIVTLRTAIDGWPVEIFDTAGLREAGDEIERAGIDLARQRILAADLVVLVSDISQPWSERDTALLEACPGALLVHNKGDLPHARGPRPRGVELSAIGAEGIDALCEEIAQRLVPHPPLAGAAVPFEPEQVEQVRRVLGANVRDFGWHATSSSAMMTAALAAACLPGCAVKACHPPAVKACLPAVMACRPAQPPHPPPLNDSLPESFLVSCFLDFPNSSLDSACTLWLFYRT